jgi:peptidoglycan/LPS O-acetylase OafA/YrhL
MIQAGSSFRADIEGLRGLAILLVVGYHLGVPGFGGGFVGVDVFFALSGYLITGALCAELGRTGGIDLIHFYARRTRRLLPAAATVLLATLAIGRVLLSPIEQHGIAASAVATAAYLSNVLFAQHATDYFASAPSTDPFLHTWSLSVEEQFYLVWPLVMLIGYRMRRLAGTIALVGLVSFGLCLWLTAAAQPWAFFGSPSRAWQFGIGALAAMAPWPSQTAWPGLLMVLAAAVGFDERTSFPGYAALLPTLGTAALVATANPHVRALCSARILRTIGRISYSWYLWHWPILVFAKGLWPGLTLAERLLVGFASLALAALTHALIENPLRFYRPLVRRPALSLACALILTAVSVGTSTWWRQSAISAENTPDQRRFAAARNDAPLVVSTGCHLTREQVAQPQCLFGVAGSPTTVALFGDSHAAHWFPALARLAADRGWRLASFTKSGCSFADVSVFDFRRRRSYTECEEWREAVAARLLTLKPSLIVLATSNQYLEERATLASVTPAQWFDGLRRTLALFDSEGIQTVVIEDTPTPGFDVPICLARRAWTPLLRSRTCAFERSLDSTATRIGRAAADGLSHVQLIDLSDRICRGAMCAPVAAGVMVYQDDSHLTARFSRSLAPELGRRIGVVGPASPADAGAANFRSVGDRRSRQGRPSGREG